MTYPKYYKTTCQHIKVIDENNELWVTKNRITKNDWYDQQHLINLEATESTETEFKKAFNKTSKYLKSLI